MQKQSANGLSHLNLKLAGIYYLYHCLSHIRLFNSFKTGIQDLVMWYSVWGPRASQQASGGLSVCQDSNKLQIVIPRTSIGGENGLSVLKTRGQLTIFHSIFSYCRMGMTGEEAQNGGTGNPGSLTRRG